MSSLTIMSRHARSWRRAPSAMRRIEMSFLECVKREAGFDVEVISGEEEARRTLLGIRSGLPVGVTDILALDIGGGSTEFILGSAGQKPIVRSIDIGVVRLCERLLHHDPPTDEEVSQAREWVTPRDESGCCRSWMTIARRHSSAPPARLPALPPWPRSFRPTNRPESINIS